MFKTETKIGQYPAQVTCRILDSILSTDLGVEEVAQLFSFQISNLPMHKKYPK